MTRAPYLYAVTDRAAAGGRVNFALKPPVELPITNVDPPTHGAHHEG